MSVCSIRHQILAKQQQQQQQRKQRQYITKPLLVASYIIGFLHILIGSGGGRSGLGGGLHARPLTVSPLLRLNGNIGGGWDIISTGSHHKQLPVAVIANENRSRPSHHIQFHPSAPSPAGVVNEQVPGRQQASSSSLPPPLQISSSLRAFRVKEVIGEGARNIEGVGRSNNNNSTGNLLTVAGLSPNQQHINQQQVQQAQQQQQQQQQQQLLRQSRYTHHQVPWNKQVVQHQQVIPTFVTTTTTTSSTTGATTPVAITTTASSYHRAPDVTQSKSALLACNGGGGSGCDPRGWPLYKSLVSLQNPLLLGGDILVRTSRPAPLSIPPLVAATTTTSRAHHRLYKTSRSASVDPVSLWPNGIIFYELDESVAHLATLIWHVMQQFHMNTCIRFAPRQNNEPDFIRVVAMRGCFSYIGRIGGEQVLSLGDGCEFRGTIAHELLHAVGFYHHQNRSDRDDFLEILWENVAKGKEDQFKKMAAEENYLLNEFDYNSIMLYGPHTFGKTLDKITMKPKREGVILLELIEKHGLSVLDIDSVNKLYKCGSKFIYDLDNSSIPIAD